MILSFYWKPPLLSVEVGVYAQLKSCSYPDGAIFPSLPGSPPFLLRKKVISLSRSGKIAPSVPPECPLPLHPLPFTLYSSLFTLHSSPFTLHSFIYASPLLNLTSLKAALMRDIDSLEPKKIYPPLLRLL